MVKQRKSRNRENCRNSVESAVPNVEEEGVVAKRQRRRKSGNSENCQDSEESTVHNSENSDAPRRRTNGTLEDGEQHEVSGSNSVAVEERRHDLSTKVKKVKSLTMGQLLQRQQCSSKSELAQSSGASLAVQLAQGLMANDVLKLDSVLRESKVEIIQSTLLDLQVLHVVPLLKALYERISSRSATNIKPWIVWIQCILSLHASYLASIRNLETELGGLLEWMRLRVGHQQKLLELHGKLSIVSEQIERRMNRTITVAPQPLLVFNDDMDSDLEDVESGGSDESGVSSDEEEEEWWDESGLRVGDESADDGDDDGSDDNSDLDLPIEKADDDSDGSGIEENDGGLEEESSDDEDQEDSENEMDIG
ncbi:hypothetical protein KIN20_001827 [Parelaphostrongylus tenuis]|uniref:Small-subunit processome Utp12 domain-containing protein n=1 Tax=Parelaphostrongylus tenuis TaxID=148309 RepID=A0AAD5QEX4_PARTN|nr:hypothetical protein KIN20_001827 [Parelaphostrongylus tenuis]